jgi:hypothetical protein
MKTLAQASETIERLDAEYWAADERHDQRAKPRLWRLLRKTWEAARKLPARSNADAAIHIRLAAHLLKRLSLGDAFETETEIARLERLAATIGDPDAPQPRFALNWELSELQTCADKVPYIVGEQWISEEVLRHIEAAIAWLGRSRVEHYPGGRTIQYCFPGMIIVTPP